MSVYRSEEHNYSLEAVPTIDKSVKACTAVLRFHFKMSRDALKNVKHPQLKTMLSAKLKAEKEALAPAAGTNNVE